MSWRVVVITNRCKLEYRLGFLVCRGEETKKIYLNEISTLIIESTAVSLTSALLCELMNNKTNVIFCDEKHNPNSQLLPLNSRHDDSGMIKKQITWTKLDKDYVWKLIIENKIYQQAKFLQELGNEKFELLKSYIPEVAFGDETNREGHSAKVYFNALFGLDFKRGGCDFINSALNYGYAILLSAINREVVSAGYLTQLGVKHCNEFNHFNLSCDLMEPFRPLVDRKVYFAKRTEFSSDFKFELCDILNENVLILGKVYSVSDAISIYVRRILNALSTSNFEDVAFFEVVLQGTTKNEF